MHNKPSLVKNNIKGPKVVSRPQPRGRKGIDLSLSEIVKRVENGRKDPKTRAWATETIVRSNLGGFKADKMAQAKAILERLRKDRIYIEDPIDVEFMPSAACTLDGCDGLTFLGEDCDGLVIAYLSAIESVGIEGALVAHSYESHREHTHVLAAVRDESRNTWVRCDPSTDDPFGSSSTPTRETFYAIPGGRILADSNGPRNVGSVPSGLSNGPSKVNGDFVGVGNPQAKPALTGLTDYAKELVTRRITDITIELADSWYDIKFKYTERKLLCEMIGVPVVSGNWNEEQDQYYKDMEKWIPYMINYGYEASKGDRDVFFTEEEGELILGKPGEVYVGIEKDGKFDIRDTSNPPTGTLGISPWLIAGIVIVGVGFKYLMAKEACDTVRSYIESSKMKNNQQFIADSIKRLTDGGMNEGDATEKALELQRELNNSANERARIDVDKEKVSPFAKIAETTEKALSVITIIAIGGAIVYGLTLASDLIKSKRTQGAT